MAPPRVDITAQSERPPAEPRPSTAPASVDPQKVVLEALKIAYASTGAGQYLNVYEQLRGRIEQRDGTASPAAAGPLPAPAAAPGSAPLRSSNAGDRPQAAAQPAAPARIRVVCATREDREGFFSSTALGRSLSVHRPDDVEVRLFPRNTQGLPTVYNIAIAEAARDPVILAFVHDDVHLCDLHWAESLRIGLATFEVVGLAGNRRRVPMQPGWGHIDQKFTLDKRANLSGTVAHGNGFPAESVDVFGPSRQRVVLLDGLFLAVHSLTLQSKSLRFDERFAFHFYDLDFCRQAEQAGLTLGTWPISVVHESKGSFVSDGWRTGCESYLEKWGD